MADDGSTDRTLEIIADVARDAGGPTEVRVAHTDRVGGPTPNFDRALAACRGEILVLSDQDDVWEPTRISSILPRFPADGVARLVFSNATLIDAEGEALPGSLHGNLRVSRRERAALASGRALDVLIRRNVVTGAAAALSSELYHLATPFPETWVHDEWLAAIAASLGEVSMIDERLVRYRLHGANQIGVADPGVTSRIGRMIQPRGERYVRLQRRSRDLVARLETLAAPQEALALVRAKLDFETSRAAYAPSRLRRLGPVVKRLARGSYARYSSQRRLDAVRDILQPR